LDETFIYSILEEELEHHLRLVLQVLREHQLFAKLSKWSFYQEKIHYLGHIIFEEGITIDQTKIESIKGWTSPRNVSEDRSFMGLAGYYRIVITRFSKFSYPITSLQKNEIKFVWKQKCE
jgi:hypothetical protein